MIDALNDIDQYSEDHLLLLAPGTDFDLSVLHPQQIHVFKLWQIYVERVNPILKVTHNPTLQATIVTNFNESKSSSAFMEALLFSIYCVAVLSSTDQECLDSFTAPRDELLKRYQVGCRQALSRSKFLHTDDRNCLTALFLYLISVKPDVDRRSLSTLLGTVVRIAQGMGIHSEVTNSKHRPFEAEMRRRLWWAIVLFDNRVCEGTNNGSYTILIPTWDCEPPSNLNDFELHQEMKKLPVANDHPSEALYAVVRSQYGEFLRHSEFHLDLVNPLLKRQSKMFPKEAGKEVDDLNAIEQEIKTKYMNHCSLDNPLHFLTTWTIRSQLAKSRLLQHYWTHARARIHQTEAQRDTCMSHALAIIECESQLVSSPLTKPFRWHISHFPFQAYVHVVQDLKRRPQQFTAYRAWEMMSADFQVRFAGVQLDGHPVFALFAETVVQAWKARDSALTCVDQSREQPWIIIEMTRLSTPLTQPKSDFVISNAGGLGLDFDFDQFLPGYMDFAATEMPFDMGMLPVANDDLSWMNVDPSTL